MQTYGLHHVWQQGDPVTRATALLLAFMSIATWTVILLKSIELRQMARRAARAEQQIWDADLSGSGVPVLGEPGSPFHDVAEAGRLALARHEASRHRRGDRADVSDWLTRCLKAATDDASASLQRGLALLASIGAIAPFVGLFGTVWGIYHALVAIGASGDASLDQVAGPIGETLVMTAFGLFVAIPAVVGYNALTRMMRGIVARLNRFGHNVHTVLLTGPSASVTRLDTSSAEKQA
ncbi:MAG: MotA/TolQ/ExbB proton channel family protein [Paraburkholderia sp.]|uniref:MotA/TolQ/ExbB proton channel family protein n=1 Tax=Paraburkholderia sp. TaxID=1926495 RepID=UPI0012045C4B|nr:MotA/TolQ/ExbB proton channel family protein [Paraburkholderia sp.]TAM08482.1 MAG: MotA/TolQ/ExbB proton channel family protein [Paraburkholderia sp.]TAM30221.1 MAG: MotA/TolQ/ExbB proton channel family protein [Paraburkholderia sp.]